MTGLYTQGEQHALAGPICVAAPVPALLAVEGVGGRQLHDGVYAGLVAGLELAYQGREAHGTCLPAITASLRRRFCRVQIIRGSLPATQARMGTLTNVCCCSG